MSDNEKLKKGWQEFHTGETGEPYYYNEELDVTTWRRSRAVTIANSTEPSRRGSIAVSRSDLIIESIHAASEEKDCDKLISILGEDPEELDVSVAEWASWTLMNMTFDDPASGVSFSSPKGSQAILKTLKAKGLDHPRIASDLCMAIVNLTIDSNGPTSSFGGQLGCSTLFSTLQHYAALEGDDAMTICESICAAMVNLTHAGGEDRAALGQLGLCALLIGLLRRCTAGPLTNWNMAIVDTLCSALRNLTHDNIENRQLAGEAGACECLADIVAKLAGVTNDETNRTAADILDRTYSALRNLIYDDEINTSRLAQTAIASEMVAEVKRICAARPASSTDLHLLENVTAVIRNLLATSANVHAKQSLSVMGVCSVLVTVLRGALLSIYSLSTTDNVCASLRILLSNSAENKTSFGDCGGCEVVVSLLPNILPPVNPDDPLELVAESLTGLLYTATYNSLANVDRVMRGGGCEVLITAFEKWRLIASRSPAAGSTVNSIAGCLRNLCIDRKEVQDRLRSLGVCEALVDFLKTKPTINDLVCAAIAALVVKNAGNKAWVGSLGACPVLVTLISSSGASGQSILQLAHCLSALKFLTNRNPKNTISLLNAGGCEEVTKLMDMLFPTSGVMPVSLRRAELITESICAVLKSVTVLEDLDISKTGAYKRLLDSNTPAVLTRALTMGVTSGFAYTLLTVIRNLTHTSKELREAFSKAGACEATVECFSSVRIVGEDHLCAIVANLAVEGSCRGRLGEAGACEAVVESLKRSQSRITMRSSLGQATGAGSVTDGKLELEACVAIINLAWGDHIPNIRRLKAAGVAGALTDVVNSRANNGDAKTKAKQGLLLVA